MYNVEKYIGKGLESLLAQTFQNFEVIVVDDCSTDNSVAVVESYVPKFDERLKLYHMKKNSGTPGAPRNKGLMLSRGEYIYFMDSDDKLAVANALELMFNLVKHFNADIIHFTKHYEATADGKITKIISNTALNSTDKIIIDENLPMRFQGILKNKYWHAPWRHFIKRDLMVEHDLFFPKLKTAEDIFFTSVLLLYSKKLLIVPHPIYVYHRSENSATRSRRTDWQKAKNFLESLIIGLQWLGEALNKIPFLQENPVYIQKILNQLAFFRLQRFLPYCNDFSDTYKLIKDVQGERDIMLAVLCTLIKTQQKQLTVNTQNFQQFAAQAQKRIAEFESVINSQQKVNVANVQHFQQFAAQAQKRIVELENEIRRLKEEE